MGSETKRISVRGGNNRSFALTFVPRFCHKGVEEAGASEVNAFM